MTIDDTIVGGFFLLLCTGFTSIAAGVGWCLRKLTKLSVDVALIKQKLHMP